VADYLYIHIPFCFSKCSYCDFFSLTCKNNSCIPDSYVQALSNEINFTLKNKEEKLKSIYVGGGTPSLLSREQIDFLFSFLLSYIDPLNTEITFEVNPEDVNEELLECLWQNGVNRISCGIQSMNQESLDFVKRRGNLNKNKEVIALLKSKWPGEISLDFISGLPYENEKSLIEGLAAAVKIKAGHISMYSLVVEEETPLGKEIENGHVTYDFDYSDKLWLLGRDFLESNGYKQYEISNFSLPGKESIHNSAYWSHQSYFGCGSGATGTIYNSDGTAFRYTNSKSLDKYIKFWTEKKIDSLNLPCDKEHVSFEDSSFEFFMMGLRRLCGVSEKVYENFFKSAIPDKVLSLFYDWKKKGLAKIEGEAGNRVFALNSKGILFLNKFLEEI